MSLTEIAAVTNSNVVLVVWMEDEKLHTDEHPTCSDPTCPCNEDTEPPCLNPACPCHEAEAEVEHWPTREDHLREDREYRAAKVQARMAERMARQEF